MRLRSDGRIQLSPSDLSAHLACPHLTTLELAVVRGELERPHVDDTHVELIFRKGREHEAAYLARLEADGRSVVRIPTYDDEGFDAEEARRLTEEAIGERAADVIYQPYLVSLDARWRGFADFLERTAEGTYEPVDTKLARSAKPAHVLQLLFYAEQVERLQGAPVERIHVENGLGERESFRVAELHAYNRRVRGRFLDALGRRDATYPWPCAHCGICDFRNVCRERRVEDDHLVLVAGMRRGWAETLIENGIGTLAELGVLPGSNGGAPDEMRAETFERLRHQAELQLRGRVEGRHLFELLPDEEERGFRLLPAPDRGDVWLDLEGHPFYETSRGLEFLFGYCYRDAEGAVRYEALWARDRDGEREVFTRFVDWLVERRRQHPGMHVYHYAAYERTALTRLAGEHGTREQEVDDVLRGELLVDLYRIVRQALRASTDSYSIKAIEALYGFIRTASVKGGDDAVVAFEEWLETGDDAILEGVERYNEEDCRSTYELHAWLLSIRPAGLPWRTVPEPRERKEEAVEADAERAALKARLRHGAEEGEPRRLLAHLVDYHQREQRPQWWEWFRWPQLDDDELIRDRTAIGGLAWDGVPPEAEEQSHAYRMTFPPQEHKLEGEAWDPDTRRSYRIRVDDEHGLVTVVRGKKRADEPLPRGLTPGKPIEDWVKRDALLRFVRPYADGDLGAYPSLVALLERRQPDVRLDRGPVEAARTLGASYLFVQGPPGSGKTWQGARMAIALMRDGKRVGVTSLSHRAINNLLAAIQEEADRQDGFVFTGVKRARDEEGSETRFESRCVVSSTEVDVCADPAFDLVAGTGWALTREAVDLHEAERPVDVLFVDEAGQLSLADVLAAGTSARSLVLLGDPNQLPQVSQGSHPEGSGRSVLQHLLGDHQTVPADEGLFLAKTWRLRPELCAFTSDAYYEGRLGWAPPAAARSLARGNGPAWIPVEHEGHGQSSPEEVRAISTAVGELLGTPFTDEHGSTRPLAERDILVVAPYNAQVRMLRAKLPAAVRVGTVDKFQGQQAPVVFVSMASSTSEDAPRGLGFAFDSHRFNVATSRAQCRAVLVCSPALLDADCRTVGQMRLVSAVCRFVELTR
ncbi:MAG: TM0106 family RecB-like putative nuclease [Gaiella sp.]|nr:TM0106 family RecB-like putative nuclease [Gaiella sp.]